jgi:hypothetical protein
MFPMQPEPNSRQALAVGSILAFFLAAFSALFAAAFLRVVIATGFAGFSADGAAIGFFAAAGATLAFLAASIGLGVKELRAEGTACGSRGSSSSWRSSSWSRSPSCWPPNPASAVLEVFS